MAPKELSSGHASRELRRQRPLTQMRTRIAISLLTASIGAWLPAQAAAERLYVSCSGNKIFSYDVSMNSSSDVTSTEQLFSATNLNSPWGLACDAKGNVYAANQSSTEIAKFSAAGTFLGYIGASPNPERPRGLAFDQNGNLYASNSGNFGNSTISRFNADGLYEYRIGRTNTTPFDALACDKEGNIYASMFSNVVYKYDPSGRLIGGTGQYLNRPKGLAVDSSGNLYAANNGSNTVSKFSAASTFVTSFGNPSQLNGATGIALDHQGNIYVSSIYGSTITKYDSTGAFRFSWTTPAQPTYLAVSPLLVPEPTTWMSVAMAAALQAAYTTYRALQKRAGRRGGYQANGS